MAEMENRSRWVWAGLDGQQLVVNLCCYFWFVCLEDGGGGVLGKVTKIQRVGNVGESDRATALTADDWFVEAETGVVTGNREDLENTEEQDLKSQGAKNTKLVFLVQI